MELFPIRKLDRDPIRFDGLELLSKFLVDRKLSIKDPGALQEFVDVLTDTAKKSLANEALIHGRRTEAMFEMVVASLGKVALLKQEDSGDFYFSGTEELTPADFRILLPDRTQYLIEVKNFHPKDPVDRFEVKAAYIDSLETYAKLMKCELLFAIYWSHFGLWTLVPTQAFRKNAERASIALTEALPVSQMALLGDLMIGTRPPLQFRLEITETGRDGDKRSLRIEETKLFCNGQEITDPIERKIAFVLTFFGKWKLEEPTAEMREGKVVAVDHFARPDIPDPDHKLQEWEMIGYLSSIVSSWIEMGTSDEDGIKATRMNFKPGEFGRLIPEGYKGMALPLWQLVMQPNEKVLKSLSNA
jgi:hypothetical protein